MKKKLTMSKFDATYKKIISEMKQNSLIKECGAMECNEDENCQCQASQTTDDGMKKPEIGIGEKDGENGELDTEEELDNEEGENDDEFRDDEDDEESRGLSATKDN